MFAVPSTIAYILINGQAPFTSGSRKAPPSGVENSTLWTVLGVVAADVFMIIDGFLDAYPSDFGTAKSASAALFAAKEGAKKMLDNGVTWNTTEQGVFACETILGAFSICNLAAAWLTNRTTGKQLRFWNPCGTAIVVLTGLTELFLLTNGEPSADDSVFVWALPFYNILELVHFQSGNQIVLNAKGIFNVAIAADITYLAC
jgi:hypothetical protein